jgi:co-chaperonin GroES (HSP10)
MIQPLHDNIAVKPDPYIQKGILIIPEEDTQTGVVVAIGPGKKDSKRPLMVRVGDHVMYSGTIDRKYEDLVIMKDKDVIGLV